MTTLDEYLATMPPMQRGRARKALERQQGFNGELHTRSAYAERHYARLRPEFGRNRVWTGADTFFAIDDVTVAFCDYVAWLRAAHPDE